MYDGFGKKYYVSNTHAFSTPDIKYDELKMMIDQKKEESYDFITRALCNG